MVKNIIIYSDGTGQVGGLRPDERRSILCRDARTPERVTEAQSRDQAVGWGSNAGQDRGHHDFRGERTYPHRPQEAGRR
jgi:hypothetical protein